MQLKKLMSIVAIGKNASEYLTNVFASKQMKQINEQRYTVIKVIANNKCQLILIRADFDTSLSNTNATRIPVESKGIIAVRLYVSKIINFRLNISALRQMFR